MDTLPDTLFENWPDTWDLGVLLSNETDLAASKPLDPGCISADTYNARNGGTDGDIKR